MCRLGAFHEIGKPYIGDSVIYATIYRTLVYYENDGQPLPDNDGRIALIAAKDLRTGPRHVKWLQALEVKKIVE